MTRVSLASACAATCQFAENRDESPAKSVSDLARNLEEKTTCVWFSCPGWPGLILAHTHRTNDTTQEACRNNSRLRLAPDVRTQETCTTGLALKVSNGSLVRCIFFSVWDEEVFEDIWTVERSNIDGSGFAVPAWANFRTCEDVLRGHGRSSRSRFQDGAPKQRSFLLARNHQWLSCFWASWRSHLKLPKDGSPFLESNLGWTDIVQR